jgi:nicotinamidase-related amidase
MSPRDTRLLVIDVQERLMPLMTQSEHLIWNVGRLLDAAAILGMEVWATEQYPQGLGPSVPPLSHRLPPPKEKLMFSCRECLPAWTNDISESKDSKILLAGIETHICVQQTAFDFLDQGYRVYLAIDAVGSRFSSDHEVALRRLESAGVQLTTTESAIFEWCEVAGTAEFKQISRLATQTCPSTQEQA